VLNIPVVSLIDVNIVSIQYHSVHHLLELEYARIAVAALRIVLPPTLVSKHLNLSSLHTQTWSTF
jgi:hypothetical protein